MESFFELRFERERERGIFLQLRFLREREREIVGRGGKGLELGGGF